MNWEISVMLGKKQNTRYKCKSKKRQETERQSEENGFGAENVVSPEKLCKFEKKLKWNCLLTEIETNEVLPRS